MLSLFLTILLSSNLIDATLLNSWYERKVPMVLLDARSEPYYDGWLLPNARWLPAESSDLEIQAAVPSKESLIVVYCHGVDCPASGWLYTKLETLGYTHLFEYEGGIDDWIEKGFPIVRDSHIVEEPQ